MFRRSLTPFSSTTWVTAWISLVCLMGSVGERRPLDLTRLEAKMVLIRVDLPRPVWPVGRLSACCRVCRGHVSFRVQRALIFQQWIVRLIVLGVAFEQVQECGAFMIFALYPARAVHCPRHGIAQNILPDLPTQITLNWNPRFRSFFSIWVVMLSKPTWLLGKTLCAA